MTLPTITFRASGENQNSSSSIGSVNTGNLVIGAQKVVGIIFATARSDTVTNTCRVTAVASSGLTFTEVFDEGIEFNVGGAFPITNWHLQMFTAPVSADINQSWSSTMSAGFTNEQIAIIFDVANLANKAAPFDGGVAPGLATHFTTSNTNAASPAAGSVNLTTTSNDDINLSIFLDSNPDADVGPVTASAGAGQTLLFARQSVRQYAEGNLLVQYKNSAAPVTTEAETTGFTAKFRLNVALAFTGDNALAATVAARPTALVAEVLENVAGNLVVTATAAEVLNNQPGNLVVTATAVEVLRTVADNVVNGNANGATVTVLTQILQNANATGATLTATSSLIAGTADAYVPIPGQTLPVVTASVSQAGEAHTAPIDGSPIYEVVLGVESSTIYQFSDYDSIWSMGDRYHTGLMTFGTYGYTNALFWDSAFNDGYSIGPGDGPIISGPSGPSATWMTFADGQKVDIRGFILLGNEDIASDFFFKFVGGSSPGVISSEAYGKEADAMSKQQGPIFYPGSASNLRYTEYVTTPRLYIPYSHYEWVYDSGSVLSTRFCNEIWLKVAHSNLDGGDRRPTNGNPAKQVLFTYSPDWSVTTTSPGSTSPPQDALFDGVRQYPGITVKNKVGFGAAAGSNTPQTTVGAWFQYVFPRPVIPNHFMMVHFSTQETYVGNVPQTWGLWHWEYSLDSGATWVPIGGSWSFHEGCNYMVAPRNGQFNLGPLGDGGKGASHWRMVLDQGPTFGGKLMSQFMFDLIDVTGQAPPLTIAFSDDSDETAVTPLIGSPGSPYVVGLSDGDDDKLTVTVVNTPNPVLTMAFDDGGTFDAWSNLSPSVVVQTVVVTTGR